MWWMGIEEVVVVVVVTGRLWASKGGIEELPGWLMTTSRLVLSDRLLGWCWTGRDYSRVVVAVVVAGSRGCCGTKMQLLVGRSREE